MKMQLSREPRIKYSPSEHAMFSLLGTEFTPSDQLVRKWIRKWYSDKNDVPYHVRGVVNATIRELDRKMTFNGERLRIERTRRKPSSIRLVKKSDFPGLTVVGAMRTTMRRSSNRRGE